MTSVLSDAAVRWLAQGEQGISSRAMFNRLALGIEPHLVTTWGMCNPWDPADFNRCEKLLRQVPELRERIALMADVSRIWANLVDHWQQIVDTFENECPGVFKDEAGHWKAPRTYDLMRRGIEGER